MMASCSYVKCSLAWPDLYFLQGTIGIAARPVKIGLATRDYVKRYYSLSARGMLQYQ